MRRMTFREKLNNTILMPLIVLTLILFLVEIAVSFILNPAVFHTKIVSTITLDALSSWVIMRQIVFFAVVQIALHSLVALSAVVCAALVAKIYLMNLTQKIQFATFTWMMELLILYVGNNLYFPHSKFAFITLTPTKLSVLSWIYSGALFVLFFIVFFTCCGLLVWLKQNKNARLSLGLLGLLAVIGSGVDWWQGRIEPLANRDEHKPNIILLGVDSLRPDFMTRSGAKTQVVPTVDAFVKRATVFSNAYTPLARTFPAWVSILTGRYPPQNGAIFNLLDFSKINIDGSLALELKKMGYYTVFAIDERRFSNLDESFGFDKTIGPQIGLNDFLLGTFNDFPVSNLMVNTWLGRWLFPYSYANRAAAVTYRPSTFVKMFKRDIAKVKQRPLFLAVHLCLPHWPFFWAKEQPEAGDLISSARHARQHAYPAALQAADQQLKAIIDTLKQMGLFDNSIVILLSDHGEAIGLSGDSVTLEDKFIAGTPRPKSLGYFNASDLAYGHGVDVTSIKAMRILLAIRLFGKQHNVAKSYDFPTSLVDIKPTILSFLGQRDPSDVGISLQPFVLGEKSTMDTLRPLFIESGLTVPALGDGELSVKSVVAQGLDYYRLDPILGRLVIKDSKAQELNHYKQRAMVYGDWYIVYVPSFTEEGKPVSRILLVNLKTGEWTDNLHSSFAKQAPLSELLTQLTNFYKKQTVMDLGDYAEMIGPSKRR